MTRELLLEYICPGYRAPDCFKGDISFNCSDCNRVLNEMLDEYDKQIRADAIDEFATKICEILEKYQTGFNMVSMANIWLISRELAEQLKAGGKNE